MKKYCSIVFLFAILSLLPGGQARANPAFRSFDDTMTTFMAERSIPGGAVAVVKDGRLVYTKGYGWADRDKRVSVEPTSLFRIASISKPVTAAAIFTLIQDKNNHLSLDTPVFPLLPHKAVPGEEGSIDPRLNTITVRHLLQHTGGWDKEECGDPMFMSLQIAEALKVPPPARQDDIVRYMRGKKLDFDPGTRYGYFNFGYSVLGRLIEQKSGVTYEDYVKKHVLSPLGITGMRCGKTLPADRAPGEVHYYVNSEGLVTSVFPGRTDSAVPEPYGEFCLEAMDSHGGWLASAVDLARFAAAHDVPGAHPLLTTDSLKAIYRRPPAPAWVEDGTPTDYYYGCGWLVRPVGNKANYWHAGMLPGTYTLLVRRHDGLSWVALFNECTLSEMNRYGEIDLALHKAAAGVTRWPEDNLFKDYP